MNRVHRRVVRIENLDIELIVSIPDDEDDDEYIDRVFDKILNKKYRFSDWDFIDGIS